MTHRTAALWLAFAAIVLLLQRKPNGDVDLFWQVKLGQLSLHQGRLVDADPFTSTHAGDPVPPIAWLAQIAYAGVHALGGWRLLHQLNALVFAGGLLAAALSVRLGTEGNRSMFSDQASCRAPRQLAEKWTSPQETSLPAGLLAMGLALIVAMPHCQIRPQSFAVLGLGLLLWLAASSLRVWLKLTLAAVLLVIWQNLHPSVLLAVAALGGMAAGGWLAWLLDRRRPRPWTPTAIVLLAAAATSATPMGPRIFAASARNTQVCRDLGISEWMPLWHPAALAGGAHLVWLALGVSLLLLVRVGRRARLEDVALLAALAVVSLPMYRMSLFLAVVAVPVWSRWIHLALTPDRPADAVQKVTGTLCRNGPSGASHKRCLSPFSPLAAIAVAVLTALAVPRLGRWPVLDREIPLAAAERLRAMGVRGVVYNYREWGGPLIWAAMPDVARPPDWRVTIDGRLYLYTPDEWRRYQRIAAGEVPVAQIEARYHPDAFFLRPSYDRRLIERLRSDPRWREAYTDATAAVFLAADDDG